MARTRQIKPHFLRSRSMTKVSVGAQLTFIRLWLIADDAGRLKDEDRPLYMPVTLYPYQDEPRQHVPGWLAELEKVGCIVRYRVNGQPYLRIVNWRKHQRICNATPSKLPADDAQATRESLANLSLTAREEIVRISQKVRQAEEKLGFLANSGKAREPVATTRVEPAGQRRFSPLREQLARKFSFFRAGS